jgi:predicted RNA binding protein YcfA (HicA-like mRNA interferase family)
MKPRKVLEMARSGSKNIRFEDFVKLVEAYGFVLRRISGSHHVLRHTRLPEGISVQPDRNGQAKGYQIRQFLKQVDELGLTLEGEENED